MLDEDARFLKVLGLVEDFNCRYVAKWIELKPISGMLGMVWKQKQRWSKGGRYERLGKS